MDNFPFRILLAFEHLLTFVVHRFLIFIEIQMWKHICFSDSYFYGEFWNETIVVNQEITQNTSDVSSHYLWEEAHNKVLKSATCMLACLHENLY